MANGFRTALQETESSHAEWKMAEPEHDSTEWLTSLHSRWRMMPRWNSNFNLYTHMKKEILKKILGMTGMFSLFLACAEAETILSQVLWSGSMIAICFASMKGYEVLMTDEDKEENV